MKKIDLVIEKMYEAHPELAILDVQRSYKLSEFTVVFHKPVIILGKRDRSFEVITTLAHEFGHFLSYKQGTATPKPSITEEKRAWKLGFEFLEGVIGAIPKKYTQMRVRLIKRWAKYHKATGPMANSTIMCKLCRT